MSSIPFDISEARRLKDSGKSYKQVAEVFSINASTLVSRMMSGAVGNTETRQCVACKATKVKLNRHHVCYSDNRIVLLCDKCHAKAHKNDGPYPKNKKEPVGLPEPYCNASRLAQLIYCYRTQHGFSLRDMADIIEVDFSCLQRFEVGGEISSDNMAKFVSFLFSPA